MRTRRPVWLIPATVILGAAVSARPQGQEGTPIPFRIATRVVNVNVVVTDKQGRPVTDLGKDDFLIYDKSRPQDVAFFSAIDNRQFRAGTAEHDPDSYSNQLAEKAGNPSVTILLFDALHTGLFTQGYALHRVRDYLRQIPPEEHLGIYLLTDTLKVIHPFQENAAALISAVRRYDEGRTPAAKKARLRVGRRAEDPPIDRFLSGEELKFQYDVRDASGRSYAPAEYEWRRHLTAASLSAISRQLMPVEGRKSLVWITDTVGEAGYLGREDTGRFLAGPRGVGGSALLPGIDWVMSPGLSNASAFDLDSVEVERMVRLMNNSGIAVYPVQAGGLAPFAGLRNICPYSFKPFENMGGMLELASHTGGRALMNRNDVETGIRQALDDSRFSYSLAYYPDHNHWNGEWRKIQVKVKRPGLHVLARSGYLALPDAAAIPSRNRLDFLHEIAESPVESTQLPLRVQMTKPAPPAEPLVRAAVHVDLRPILTSHVDGHQKGNFEVVFIQMDAAAKPLATNAETVSANIKPDQAEAALSKGWDLRVRFPVVRGAAQLCVILHDLNTDEVGSVHIPVSKYISP